MFTVGLTGGIGSGKSTASRVFQTLGIPVYNSDTRAKQLMTTNLHLIEKITKLLGEKAYVNGDLNRQWIAERIFNDKSLLSKMNATVHPIVIDDFKEWAGKHQENMTPYIVMENAILFEGKFDRLMDYSITISAPITQRVARAASRDNVDIHKIYERIGNQMSDKERESRADYVINNEDEALMTPQILKVHEELIRMSRE